MGGRQAANAFLLERTDLPLPRLGNFSTFRRMSGGMWFSVVVLAGLALAFGLQVRRRRQEAPLKDWIAEQPVVFEMQALVRIRASGLEGSGWGTLKSPTGARLVVHIGGLEASIGSANVLVSGNFMRTSDGGSRRGGGTTTYAAVRVNHHGS